MARASLCIFILLVAEYNGFAQASLSVSPDRSQFFNYESVRLSGCLPKVTAGSAKWKIKRNSAKGERESCPSSWGTLNGSSCNIMDTYSGDTGVYWCESDSGERSNAVNITVTDGAVILASPAAPVTVGDGVTLRCLTQDKTTKKISLISPADFYKDGSLVRTESTGEMTIPAVSKSDEGLYACNDSDMGISPESWLAVRIPKPQPSIPLHLILGTGISVALFVVITGMLFFCWRKQKDNRKAPAPEDVTYADVSISLKPRKKRERSVQGPDTVYSTVRIHTHPDNDGTCDDMTYSDINHKVKRKPQKKRGDPSPEPIYSAVRTGGPVAVPKNVTYGQIKILSNIKPQEKKAQSEPDVIYTSVKPGHSADP